MAQTGLDEVKKIAQGSDYRLIPICRTLLSDIRTPVEVLKALLNVSSHCFLLESAEDSRRWGRYTFLGFDPTMELKCKDGKLMVTAGSAITLETGDFASYVKQLVEANKSPRIDGMPTLTGGLVGYFSYDYIQYAEKSLNFKSRDNEGFPDADLMLFDKLICFDNLYQKIILIANVRTDDIEKSYNRAVMDLDAMESLIRHGKPAQPPKGRLKEELRPLLSRGEFCKKVEDIKYHIKEGDIFQLVFSNPMKAAYEGSLLDTYRVMRTSNPSPYMFYFSGDDVEMAGASPETLVKVEGRNVYTFPLAGTRPRGATTQEDMALENELLSDEKEKAEHNMLVDLGRNDLGRICKFGSVKVDKYMCVEKYSHVMHIGSSISGILRDDMQAIDAIDAVLPAGTLSGAPKIRACRLIDGLEDDRRGIYGGAIGYVDFTGNLDVCIAIRLAYKKDNTVIVRTGAGIVADSIPENEYMECHNKAKAVICALKRAEDGDI